MERATTSQNLNLFIFQIVYYHLNKSSRYLYYIYILLTHLNFFRRRFFIGVIHNRNRFTNAKPSIFLPSLLLLLSYVRNLFQLSIKVHNPHPRFIYTFITDDVPIGLLYDTRDLAGNVSIYQRLPDIHTRAVQTPHHTVTTPTEAKSHITAASVSTHYTILLPSSTLYRTVSSIQCRCSSLYT